MPAKKRRERRRVDHDAALKAWSMVFRSGFDFLHTLERAGLPVDGRLQPARAEAEAAWRALRGDFLTRYPPQEGRLWWAQREFD
ncbi:hypothetical protein SAMN06295912_13540 [Sphingomonas laterariae]|uniref:Uncharacterized protein n=1 Tax=Edaphosphingomonas laterariae TaxID=861865 RepID=A0A239JL21_9SPHN|nr:hypothetical protein SAMN06295912_13540 [Sphingomonas laterariae]